LIKAGNGALKGGGFAPTSLMTDYKTEGPRAGDLLTDIPVPRNIIEWVSGADFLNIQTIWKYMPHLEILRDFYELLCPYCNPEPEPGMNPEDFKKQILLVNDRCPKCHATKLDLYKEGLVKGFNQMIGGAGMRGGKTALASYVSSDCLGHMLRFNGTFQNYYGLLPGQDIEFAFLAASWGQAKETVWPAFKKRVQYSPWFQRAFTILRECEAEEDLDEGTMVKETMNRIDFDRWGIHFVNLSKNSATSAGRTRAGVMIDELSRFDQTDSKFSADEVYEVHQASMATLWLANEEMVKKGDWPRYSPIMVSIGSPYRRKDKIMTLIGEDAKKSVKMFVFKKATWELNPQISKDSEFIKDQYRRDPVVAERDFAANPPGAENPGFDPDKIDVCLDRSRAPILRYRVDHMDTIVQDKVFHYLRIKLDSCVNDKMTSRYIHCDAGRSDCAFGLCVFHKEPTPDGNWRFVEDAVVMIKAQRERTGNETIVWEVHFPSVEEFVLDLAKYLNIRTISFDRWQSLHFLDSLRDKKIRAVPYSVTRATYMDFQTDLYDMRISMIPGAEGSGELKAVDELKELSDDGIKMTPVQSDDLIQCVAAAHHHAKWDERDIQAAMRGKHRGGLHPQNFSSVPAKRRPGRFVHLRRY
jgi:hypothetical protein